MMCPRCFSKENLTCESNNCPLGLNSSRSAGLLRSYAARARVNEQLAKIDKAEAIWWDRERLISKCTD